MEQYKLGTASKRRLATCNIEVNEIINEAIATSVVDFGIPAYGGRRTAVEQNKLYKRGDSKKDGYEKLSKHQDGDAVDIVAYVNGGYTYERDYYVMLAGHILSTAKRLGYTLRWGGDWDSDLDLKDQTFNDLCHFELIR